MKNTPTTINKRIFILLLKLTAFQFIFIECLGALFHFVKPITQANFILDFSRPILHSWVIISGLLYFLIVQIALHLLFFAVIGFVTLLISSLFQLNERKSLWLGALLWFLCLVTVFLSNQYLYPWSLFAKLPHTPLSTEIIGYSLIFLIPLLSATALLALIQLLKIGFQKFRVITIAAVALFIVLSLLFVNLISLQPVAFAGSTTIKPNIIIIGIDSLRPDHTGFFGKHLDQNLDYSLDRDTGRHSLTPHLDQFMKGATIFTHAYTPLARTAPSWMSILTGEEPRYNGSRYGLVPLHDLKLKGNLAFILKKMGYTTVFSTDEERFNNITEAYGFDKIIAPKTGFNDFFLVSINDLPLSNLLINTWLGRVLFPYTYSNRSAKTLYEPHVFVNFLRHSLSSANLDRTRPLFLAIHLCLPHWPFTWAHAPLVKNIQNKNNGDGHYYDNAVKRSDQQFNAIIKLLSKMKLLKHAIIFVMSDHGQGLGFPNERVTNIQGYLPGQIKLSQKNYQQLTESTYGHGTDVLSMAQYHIVLAFKSYGTRLTHLAKKVEIPTSLIDIEPTLLSFLKQPPSHAKGHHADAISLLPFISGKKTQLNKPRNLFLETGFTLAGVEVANPNIKTVLEQGLSYFKILPKTGAIVIKPRLRKLIIKGKERAVIRYPWFLARYPTTTHNIIILIANLKTKHWTTDLNTPFAQHSPARSMLIDLQKFYGKEIEN